jgi:secernin
MVSLGSASFGGNTIFAKNSDRPADEAQPLELHPRQYHAAGSDAGCQFVSVPQVEVTYRHIGSRPYWCHGYEHGANEHQVVIGNEALPSKQSSAAEPRLIGMELVRLGLERGATAREAVGVITSLTSEFGQGAFDNSEGIRTYDNAFIVADPEEAYAVETIGHNWAVKALEETASISNVGSIRADWDSTSQPGDANGDRLDWGAAYADLEGATDGARRQCRSDALLRSNRGRIEVETMIDVLSDHWLNDDLSSPPNPYFGDHRGICTHTQPGGAPSTTAASIVTDLRADDTRLPVYWCNLYSPCMGLFVPVFLQGELPERLSTGGRAPTADSPWWTFHAITQDGLATGRERVEEIRSAWAPLQAELLQSAYVKAEVGRNLIARGAAHEASEMLTEYMADNVNRMMAITETLLPTRVTTAK